MEFRVVWQLIQHYVKNTIKRCCFENCNAPIINVYHMWSNHSEVHVRLQCENQHYDWQVVPIHKLAKYDSQRMDKEEVAV